MYESNYSRYLKNKNVGTVIKMKKSKVYEYKYRVKSGYQTQAVKRPNRSGDFQK